jgi:hypothetical protein
VSAAPTRAAIVEANAALLARLGVECPATSCWACRIACVDGTPNRAHVVGRSRGGSYEPSNFFLLCDHCHGEQPDGATRESQETWLASAPSWWEWSGRLVERALDAVHDAAARRGLGRDAVLSWLRQARGDGADAIARGYATSAGIENGRANAISGLVALFETWAAERVAPTVSAESEAS